MSLPIQNITERQVQKALNDIRQARHSRTVIITRTLLNMALTKAHHLGLIKTNPVAGTSVQKSESSFGGKALSAAEQEKLLDYCHNHKSAVSDLLYTIYRTGCRTGEARALRSADVTPTGIHIRHALDRDGNLKGVKSNQARFVPIVDNVLLSRLIERSRTYNGFIFLSRNATTLDHNNISRRVRTLLEGHSPHDLRHTYITEAIRRGANLKALSEITGDQVNTLLTNYTHVNHDDLTALANMMLGTTSSTMGR